MDTVSGTKIRIDDDDEGYEDGQGMDSLKFYLIRFSNY